MRDGAIEVAPGRYRETFGRYFEDFNGGEIYEHRPGRTISETPFSADTSGRAG